MLVQERFVQTELLMVASAAFARSHGYLFDSQVRAAKTPVNTSESMQKRKAHNRVLLDPARAEVPSSSYTHENKLLRLQKASKAPANFERCLLVTPQLAHAWSFAEPSLRVRDYEARVVAVILIHRDVLSGRMEPLVGIQQAVCVGKDDLLQSHYAHGMKPAIPLLPQIKNSRLVDDYLAV